MSCIYVYLAVTHRGVSYDLIQRDNQNKTKNWGGSLNTNKEGIPGIPQICMYVYVIICIFLFVFLSFSFYLLIYCLKKLFVCVCFVWSFFKEKIMILFFDFCISVCVVAIEHINSLNNNLYLYIYTIVFNYYVFFSLFSVYPIVI